MKLEYWNTIEAHKLAAFYNAEFLQLPYYYHVSEEEFVNGIRSQEESDSPCPDLSKHKLIVAMDQGEIQGFAHVAVWSKAQDSQLGGVYTIEALLHNQIGMILFFHYRRGFRAAGQAILDDAERFFRDHGLSQIRVFSYYGYRFHRFSHAFCSDRMPHVMALLGRNRYRIILGWIYTVMSDFQAVKPSVVPSGLTVQAERQPGHGDLPNIQITLFRQEAQIGQTCAWSAGHTCQAQNAQDIFKIMWFSVSNPEDRGKGYGRYLMQALLWEAQQAGYRHASTGATPGNYRANLLYFNSGFQTVDTNYTYFKDLDSEFPGYPLDEDTHPE